MFKSRFFQNVLTVMSGAIIIQVLNFSFMPIITRLFTPAEFGAFSQFIAVFNVCAPVTALCLPLSIVLPKSNIEAVKIARTALVVSMVTSVVVLLVVFLVNLSGLYNNLYFFLPFLIFSYSIQQVCQQWLIRENKFNNIRKVNVINALFLNCSKLFVGFSLPTASSLIVTTFLAISFQVFSFIKVIPFKLISKTMSFKLANVKFVFNKYSDFPAYRAPQVFINTLSRNLPVFILGTQVGVHAAGYYALAQSVLTTPVSVLGSSLSSVLLPTFSVKIREGHAYKSLFLKCTVTLFIIGALCMLPFFLWGPEIFIFVFGDKWEIAGVYSQCLSVWIVFWLASRPAIDAVPALGLQKQFFELEVYGVIMKAAVLTVGLLFYNEFAAIVFFSITSIILNLLLFYLVVRYESSK